jgi:hypothetical protein
VKNLLPAVALLWVFPHLATAQVAILHIQVIEGEGAINMPGSRIAHPLTVEITDETGKPVEGAAVSFHLPEDGPGGTFSNGLRTDVTLTDARGRASLRTLLVNRAPGRLPIRVVASKEQARAGMVSFQYIAEPKGGAVAAAGSKSTPSVSHSKLKWVVLAVLASGGAVAAGTLLAGKSGNAAATAVTTVPVGTAVPVAVGINIGSPTITVGHP